jgi:hypothetical protein
MSNSSSTTFQAWVTEVIVQLLANGVTQTSDTGQMANPCVTAVPGTTATSAGYYVFEFNDTLQGTAPIVFRLDFGTGSATTTPAMWITVGTGSNGSGTINGTSLAKLYTGGISAGSLTAYTSRFCYNTAQGFLGVILKIGGGGVASAAQCGFCLFRTVNAAGVSTGDGVMLLTTSDNTAAANSGGYMALINFNTSTTTIQGAVPLTAATNWCFVPYTNVTGEVGTETQVWPVFQVRANATTPGQGVTNALALCCNSDIPLGGTFAVNILGSLSYTYINVGTPFGATQLGLGAYSAANFGLFMLWQ